MHLLYSTILVATIVLVGSVDTTLASTYIKKPDTTTSLRTNVLFESTNQGIVKRSLRKKNKALNDGDHEERGRIQWFLGCKLNLSTIKDDGLDKIMASSDAQQKAFNYLDRRNINTQVVYSRLKVDEAPDDGVRYNFFEAYGNWRVGKYGDQAR
ncbi:RxLR effector protein [Phytophthora megakarya]|uniref:RxLR effector protein n=1 Tax=Phytophthora megakarya TaxID=4795 RepID=A0A225UVF9_9STRA|nr:RxLR effector protein [Phytophthora megakarya]